MTFLELAQAIDDAEKNVDDLKTVVQEYESRALEAQKQLDARTALLNEAIGKRDSRINDLKNKLKGGSLDPADTSAQALKQLWQESKKAVGRI